MPPEFLQFFDGVVSLSRLLASTLSIHLTGFALMYNIVDRQVDQFLWNAGSAHTLSNYLKTLCVGLLLPVLSSSIKCSVAPSTQSNTLQVIMNSSVLSRGQLKQNLFHVAAQIDRIEMVIPLHFQPTRINSPRHSVPHVTIQIRIPRVEPNRILTQPPSYFRVVPTGATVRPGAVFDSNVRFDLACKRFSARVEMRFAHVWSLPARTRVRANDGHAAGSRMRPRLLCQRSWRALPARIDCNTTASVKLTRRSQADAQDALDASWCEPPSSA